MKKRKPSIFFSGKSFKVYSNKRSTEQFPLKCRPVFLVHTLWTPICIVIQIFGSCLIFVMTDANSPTHTNKRNSLLLLCSLSYKWEDSDHWAMKSRWSSRLFNLTKVSKLWRCAVWPAKIARGPIGDRDPRKSWKKSDATIVGSLLVI